MTKKDYELIADIVKRYIDLERQLGNDDIVRVLEAFVTSADGLAVNLMKTNLKFDYDKFLAACGVEENL